MRRICVPYGPFRKYEEPHEWPEQVSAENRCCQGKNSVCLSHEQYVHRGWICWVCLGVCMRWRYVPCLSSQAFLRVQVGRKWPDSPQPPPLYRASVYVCTWLLYSAYFLTFRKHWFCYWRVCLWAVILTSMDLDPPMRHSFRKFL